VTEGGCQESCQSVSEPVRTLSEQPETVSEGPDWTAIKRDYASSFEPARVVAARYGISPDSLYQRSKREGWQRAKSPAVIKAKQAVQRAISQTVAKAVQAAQPAVDKAVQEWQARSVRVAAKAFEHVEDKLSRSLDSDELKTVIQAADGADRIGRRGLGLDKGDSASPDGTPVRVQLGIRLDLLGGADGLATLGPVLDVSAEQAG